MSALAGTTQTYGVASAGGNREDLEDVIWELDPLEYYCQTNFDRVDANATFHEWEMDTIVAATSNLQLEGNDGSFTSIVSPTRAGNYCQILKKEFLVSGTQEVVAKAGRKSEVQRQVKKQMKEIKNDFEFTIVRNQASSAGGATTARALGSIESWIASTDNGGNGVRATTTASASTAAFAANVVAAPTDGSTTGPVAEATLKEALRLSWTNGGQDPIILVGSTQKTAISAFSGIATKTTYIPNSQERATILASADMYVSEYGYHKVILHRHVRTSLILCLDPDYWAIAFLRKPFIEDLAKTGDGFKKAIRMEGTLVSRNHLASAKVAACT
jgi:Family of unknown function (DUF5309)